VFLNQCTAHRESSYAATFWICVPRLSTEFIILLQQQWNCSTLFRHLSGRWCWFFLTVLPPQYLLCTFIFVSQSSFQITHVYSHYFIRHSCLMSLVSEIWFIHQMFLRTVMNNKKVVINLKSNEMYRIKRTHTQFCNDDFVIWDTATYRNTCECTATCKSEEALD